MAYTGYYLRDALSSGMGLMVNAYDAHRYYALASQSKSKCGEDNDKDKHRKKKLLLL